YDTLGLQRDALRRQIDDLDQMRREGSSPAISALDQQIDQARAARLGVTGRQERRAANDAISALGGQRKALAQDLPEQGCTAERAAARRQMQDVDYQMRDLAPDVSDAYRRAQAGMLPEEAAAPSIAPTEPAAPIEPEAPAIPSEVHPGEVLSNLSNVT